MEFKHKELRRIRRAKDITQVDLAKITGIHPTAISFYENGKRIPNLKSLASLSLALNIDINKLLN